MYDEKEFLTPKQIAGILNVTEFTVYNYVNKGLLKAYKFGKTYRIDRKDFEEFMEKAKM